MRSKVPETPMVTDIAAEVLIMCARIDFNP